MSHLAVTARAHTNIALIKYWGKANSELILPANSSVSLTLDKFYTDTTVEFTPQLTCDVLTIDGQRQNPVATQKVTKFLDIVRLRAGIKLFARVDSTNHVPMAAGLASSASAYAALAVAAAKAAGLQVDAPELTRLARRGSGSASRSIDGGCVIWHRGSDDLTSFAEPVAVNPALNLRMIALVIDHNQKQISSRSGMAETVATSPYFAAWVKTAEQASAAMVDALRGTDFAKVGALAERSALMMHATTLAAEVPFTYFKPETLATLQMVQQIRSAGLPAYATMDAGPNVKVLTTAEHVEAVAAKLKAQFPWPQIICAPGPAATILQEEKIDD